LAIPVYTLSIEGEEDNEKMGVFEIANTDSPAIKMKGFAFSSHEKKSIFFKDDLKYRIASPVLTPDDIYRIDDETQEESYYRTTPEFIEQVYAKFMAERVGKDVFNEEHDESKRVPSYIFETWLVENPKGDKSYTSYGIECPKHTWFAVQQFTDKAVYLDYVDRGLTGFSIHGNANLQLSKQINTYMLKFKQKKRKVIAHYTDEVLAESGELIVGVNDIAVGEEVVVINPDMEEVEDFSGTLETTDGEVITIDANVITEVTGEVEATDEKPVEEEKPVEAEEDKPKEEEKPVEAEEVPAVDTYTKAEIDEKFKEMVDVLSAKIDELKTVKDETVEASEEKEEDQVQMKMRKIEAIKRASEQFKKQK
jgi:hypothetical protein